MKLLPGCFLVFLFISCSKDAGQLTPVTPPPPATDSFTVTVNNGYGSGKYKSGDTVHIWSKETSSSQLFDAWTGDLGLLNTNEWHAWFLMPARNAIFTANIKSITPITLNYELIRGRDRLKPVYSYFPAAHKGVVYLLHGTGGSALQITSGFEENEVIKNIIDNGFAVIVTEAEEATTGLDANGDSKLRWTQTPVDTIANIDYANIRIITDTFYKRGTTNRSKPRYSLGMSNGGAFSAALSYMYTFRAAISYCAPGGTFIAGFSTVPLQFCMQRGDNHPEVGPQGNADALANSQGLIARGVCSKYFINERSPVYPQRFARRSDISVATSAALVTELKQRGFLNGKGYFIGYSGDLATALQNNPAQFPVLSSLTTAQKLFVAAQIDCCVTDHQMYSDLSKASVKFFNTQCL